MARTPNEALAYLKSLAGDNEVRMKLAMPVLTMSNFPLWSGSPKADKHHYGKGGLVVHTAEVVQLCMQNRAVLCNEPGTKEYVNPDSLFLAALYHDVGKMWDYIPLDADYAEWDSTEHKKMIYHIQRSGLIWYQNSGGYPEQEEVYHAILAHHGRPDWGSPVVPRTRMAWLLHLCDNLSARVADCDLTRVLPKESDQR